MLSSVYLVILLQLGRHGRRSRSWPAGCWPAAAGRNTSASDWCGGSCCRCCGRWGHHGRHPVHGGLGAMTNLSDTFPWGIWIGV